MSKAFGYFLFAATCIIFQLPTASADSFSDSFETPSLDPFWTVSTTNATWSLSANQAHTGLKSLREEINVVAGQKTVQLAHSFPIPVFGTFSIWLNDPGSGGFFRLDLVPSGPSVGFGHAVVAPNGETTYDYSTPTNGNLVASAISRSAGWHKFEIAALANGVTYSVDNQVIFNGPTNGPISNVNFIAHDASSFPIVYFDDFQGTWTVPEPSTTCLGAGLFLLGTNFIQRRRAHIERAASA